MGLRAGRALQRFVENPLSIQLLKGSFHPGDLIVIDEVNDQLEFVRNQDTTTDYVNIPQDQYPQDQYRQ